MSEEKKPQLIGAPRSWFEWGLQVVVTGAVMGALGYFTSLNQSMLLLVFLGASIGSAFTLWRQQRKDRDG